MTIETFDPVSASFNELVVQGTTNLKFWRGTVAQVIAEAQTTGDERWQNAVPLLGRIDKAIQYATDIEAGKAAPPVVIQAKVAHVGLEKGR